MKKVVAIVAAMLSLSFIAGCSAGSDMQSEPSKSLEEVIEKAGEANEKVGELIAGGWQKVEDGTVTDEMSAMFARAMESYDGEGDYRPKALLETQVVAGMNYRFLCDKVVDEHIEEASQAIVEVYEDVDGNVSITSIEPAPEPDLVIGKFILNVPDGFTEVKNSKSMTSEGGLISKTWTSEGDGSLMTMSLIYYSGASGDELLEQVRVNYDLNAKSVSGGAEVKEFEVTPDDGDDVVTIVTSTSRVKMERGNGPIVTLSAIFPLGQSSYELRLVTNGVEPDEAVEMVSDMLEEVAADELG